MRIGRLCSHCQRVALRKESVDRNCFRAAKYHRIPVALRKESVDRNLSMGLDGRFKLWSLSARRAWIEINSLLTSVVSSAGSLSARRAWIEICGGACGRLSALVALRKESVDRNWWVEGDRFFYYAGRSPQGERG